MLKQKSNLPRRYCNARRTAVRNNCSRLVALSLLACSGSFCVAEEINTTAGVNLLLGLTLTEDREVDFGILSGATAGSCSMATNGTMTGATPGCTGAGVSGQFTIEGIRFFQVTVSVSPGTSDGITFTPNFGGTTTLSGFLPATFSIYGEATLNVGGDLSWSGTLSPGAKQIPFTFTADYN